MKSSCLLFFCILWSIAATDVPMSCVKCVGENENSCHGIAQKCSSATDECISVIELTKIGVRETSFFMRFCGNCSLQKTGFVRFDKGILKINATCCNTSKCTPPVPIIPPGKAFSKDEVKGNGIRCKSCYASNARNCDCSMHVNCTAGETRCISRYMSATGGHNHVATMRGCTTTEMCEVIKATEISMKLNTTRIKSNFSCSNESHSVHRRLLLLVFTAALISKFTTAT
ncbi:phospholipase A2 inhibitor NAI-like [Phyllobates terribilis]|uniref:phospholipase A2 inhibitor NAI-like n=1 Tax=Phyllobates terribilis TaxID=111132 RepID=UPI003CCAF809